MLANLNESILVGIDIQPRFIQVIPDYEKYVHRGLFLTKVAKLLKVPVLFTEQNPEKIGESHPEVKLLLEENSPKAKMCFSCAMCEDFMKDLKDSKKKQVILWGFETHICVVQTVLHLLEKGFQVQIAADAIASRDSDASQIAINRLQKAGVVVTHSESIVYEWLESAEHPKFREILQLVKQANQEPATNEQAII